MAIDNFRKLFNLQPGEGRRVAVMFSYIFLLIATLLVVKPVRNALFLTRFGVEMLPYAFMLVAVISGLVVTTYARIADKFRLNRLIQYTLIINIALTTIIWFFLQIRYDAGWFYYLIYVWVAIFGVLVTTQFWLLANYVFNVREAKRVFGVLGAGGIAGGIFGGYFTNLLAPFTGSEDLLLFGALFLIGCLVLVQFAWDMGARANYREQTQSRKKRQSGDQNAANPLSLTFQNRYLTLLATVIGIGVIVANLVDYQYSAIATSIIEDEDELTAFFGFWLSSLSVFSLIIQMLLTSRVLRRFGVSGSLQFLPGGVFAGSVMVLVSGGLTSAVMIKVFEGGFKQSIHKAGLELLWLPVPTATKNRVKAFIDVFIDNIATGIGGMMLILITSLLGWGVGGVSGLIIVLVATWLVINQIVRREYIESFRIAMEKRSIRLDEHVLNANDPTVLETVLKALDSGNEKHVMYALDMLGQVKHQEIKRRIPGLIKQHNDPNIIVSVLRIALQYDDLDLNELLIPHLDYHDPEIRFAIVHYLVTKPADPIPVLETCLADDRPRVRLTALRVAAELGRHYTDVRNAIDFQQSFEDLLIRFDEQPDDNELDKDLIRSLRIELAQVLGLANLPELYPYLHMLLADDSVDVLRAAVLAAGSTKSDEFLYTLIAHLNTKYVRTAARDALALYGDSQIDQLLDRFNDVREDLRIRMSIPDVLARIGTQTAANALQQNLSQDDITLRFACIRALNRLRINYGDVRLDKTTLDNNLLDEARTCYEILDILQLQLLDSPVSGAGEDRNRRHIPAQKLLIRALEESLDRNLETIFRLLGLRYLPDEMLTAYQQVTGSRHNLRANAIEFLDNVLDIRLKRVLLPLIETRDVELKLQQGRDLFNLNPPTSRGCMEYLLGGDDVWLKVCTLYTIGMSGDASLLPLVEPHTNSKDVLIHETANLAHSQLTNLDHATGD